MDEGAQRKLLEREAFLERQIESLIRQRVAIDAEIETHHLRLGELKLAMGWLGIDECATFAEVPASGAGSPADPAPADRQPRRDCRGDVRTHFEQHPEPLTLPELMDKLGISEKSADLAVTYLARKGYLAASGGRWQRAGYVPAVQISDAQAGAPTPASAAAAAPEAIPEAEPHHETEAKMVEELVDLISAWPGEGMTIAQIENRGIPETVVRKAGELGMVGVKRYGAGVIYVLPDRLAAE